MINLDPWQKQILKTKGDTLLCTGRRVGKTYIMARKAIDKMIKEPKTPVIVMSLTEDQAYIIIIMASTYLEEAYPKIFDKTKRTLKMLALPNGSKMISRPSGDTGDGCRGFEGGVLIVDEASRMPKLFWLASKPILLTTNGEIWMCSTPFGKKGYFWKRFEEAYIKKKKSARFTVFYKSSEDVMKNREISDSWTIEQRKGALRILKEDKLEMSELEYGQEYLGLFLEELRQFFSDELINKICVGKRVMPTKGDNFIGCDVGRVKDEFTFEIVNRMGSINKYTLKQVEHIKTNNTPIPASTRRIIDLNIQYSFKKEYIDSGGMGITVCDLLREDMVNKNKVVEINNASRRYTEDGEDRKKGILKEDLYLNLKRLMERNEVILLDDDDIKASLKSIQIEHKDKGRIYLWGSDSHITEGIIRACWCIMDKSLNPYIY